MAALKMVTLKDGSEVLYGTVLTTTNKLEAVVGKDPLALIDLVEKCKNDKHIFQVDMFNAKPTLKKFGLIDENEQIHDDVKKIVLNSITGPKFGMKLVNPLHEKEIIKIEAVGEKNGRTAKL